MLFFISCGWAMADPIVLVGDDDNIPVCYTNEEGKIVGINVDIIREMSKRAGLDIVFKLRPWKRTLHMIKHGQVHGGFPLFVTPEREKYSLYTKVPVHRNWMMVFTKPGKEFKYEKLSDLYGRTIGMNIGFSISPDFDAALKAGKFKVHNVSQSHQLVEMLLRDRLEVVVRKRLNMEAYYKKTGKKVSAIGTVNKGQGGYLVLSKAAKFKNKLELLHKIDITMLEMEKDGTIEAITNSYLQ